MCQPLAMDRLVCGGCRLRQNWKAMRAAFLAVENHKQVAVLKADHLSPSSTSITFAIVSPSGLRASRCSRAEGARKNEGYTNPGQGHW